MIAPWYTMAYVKLERIAWRHGYALALHGSMGRDLDVIAVPWTDDASSPDKLISAFQKYITERVKFNWNKNYEKTATIKPHGRMAYSIPIGHDGHYIDLSIMPRIEK